MSETASSPPPTVLFIDDDADVRTSAALLLNRRGFRLLTAANPAEAWSVLATEPVEVVLLDLNFSRAATSGDEGFRALAEIRAQRPDTVVVVVTGHSGVNIAVAAIRAGATDFVMKPWSNERLVATLTDAVAVGRARRGEAGAGEVAPSLDEAPLLGESPAMQCVREVLRRAAPTGAAVLLSGEAGTGKSHAARLLHRWSGHGGAPTLVDCLGPAEDLPPDLFGGGGAPLGGDGGAVVLEEIAGLSATHQARLLRWLETGDLNRPSESPRLLRFIATSRKSRAELAAGVVRDDLLARLDTITLALPPLRERGDDACLLADHFLRLFALRYGRAHRPLSAEAEVLVVAHLWPGNVRALRQATERAVALGQGAQVTTEDLGLAPPPVALSLTASDPDLNLVRSEKALVAAALKRHGFNVSHAARELGLTRAALYRRMAKHGL